jgi:hypothetical protein
MAGPYLKSGESIILTTDRVLIDDTEYDLILTSQRLALVDSGHTSDQPQVVPFATILSVKGRMTPAKEPVITLAIIDPVGLDDSKTIDLIFSQQPYQDRSAECDLWVKKLIENIVSVRQEPAPAGKQTAAEKATGIRPSVRRFIAPEVLLPHTDVPQNHRPSKDLLSAMQGAAWESPDIAPNEPVPEKEAATEPETPPETEETSSPSFVSGKEIPTPTSEIQETEQPVNPVEPVQSMEDIPEEGTEHATAPATPFRELIPEIPKEVQDSPAPVQPDNRQTGPVAYIEELSRQIEEIEPVQAEETVAFRTGAGEPIGLPDNVSFPVISGAAPDVVPASASPATSPAGIGPADGQPPVPQPKKKRAMIFVAVSLIILVIVGAVAIISVPPILEQANEADHPAITPIMTPPPVTTAIPTIAIPPQGVWVKVTYNGTFVGSYGNPGPTNQQEVRGTGVQVYAIRNSNNTVQASFRKLDDSGNNLTVEVYNNGTMVTHVSKSSPRAEIDILVNPQTGAPYAPVTTASA